MSELVWSPIHRSIQECIERSEGFALIIVPFISRSGLLKLLEKTGNKKLPSIVTRWRQADVASGVSDIEVYPLLRDRKCQLYLHDDIHLKLYVFSDNSALTTSGNLSDAGLGFSMTGTIESGAVVSLRQADWDHIYRVLSQSRQVDDELYSWYKANIALDIESVRRVDLLPPLGQRKNYSVANLPACERPEILEEVYFADGPLAEDADAQRRAMHDVVLYGIPEAASRTQFKELLATGFRKTPFVLDFVVFLRKNGSLRFGAVNDWIYSMCDDVPLPYRWELKESTRILYNWMEHYYSEISWERPRHSQVISWTGAQ